MVGGSDVEANLTSGASSTDAWFDQRARAGGLMALVLGRYAMGLRLLTIVALGLAVGLALGADEPKEGEVAKDLKQFQGTWTLDSMEVNGVKIDAEVMKKQGHEIMLTVKQDKVTLESKRGDVKGTIKLDPAKKPKAYDSKGTDPEGKTHEAVGIYKIEGDVLTVCYVVTGKDRPSAFEGGAGSDAVLQVFKRAKK
jgi:RNA polymerase sigma-70 factor (ECF subfamily)